MTSLSKSEVWRILHALSMDVLVLTIISVVGFWLAESILPGVFSQRVQFFFVEMWFIASIGAVVFFGGKTRISSTDASGAIPFQGWKRFAGIALLFSVILAPTLDNLSGVWYGVFLLCAGITVAYLVRDALDVRSKH